MHTVFIIILILLLPTAILSEGLAAIIASVWLFLYFRAAIRMIDHIRNNGILVKGYLVTKEKDSEGFQVSVYEFTTQSGKIIKGKALSNLKADNDLLPVSEVNLLYEPNHPSDFIVEGEYTSRTAKIIFIVITSIVFIIGCLMLWLHFPGSV